MASEPVKPYFIRDLRVLSLCLEVSNGVVNGVVECKIKFIIEGQGASTKWFNE